MGRKKECSRFEFIFAENVKEKSRHMIEKIEIQYFRSIYRASITDVKRLNVFAGKNDVGKSNVLRALNLFFNNCVIEDGDFEFYQNYNLKRLEEVRKESVKGKQFIQIKVTFRRGKQYEKSLPETFTVAKKWNRDDLQPQISDNIDYMLKRIGRQANARSRASLTRFLNNIKYVYVPAIKDNKIFEMMLNRLQYTVYSKKLSQSEQLNKSLTELYNNVVSTTEELSTEFKNATQVESMISTPKEIDELYKTLEITTKLSNGEVSIVDRGDGIRVRYIPSILNYIANNSSEQYVWGFEEPENSLEFNLARAMAEDFYNKYMKKSIIFLTSHSPAFIDLAYKDDCEGFRCFKETEVSKIVKFNDASRYPSLEEELGYASIQKKQYEEYVRLCDENQKMKEMIDNLQVELMTSQKPVLFTEGKTDAQILKVAWEKLYDYDCPFEIKSCNLMSDEENVDVLAGTGILNKILCSVRYDSIRTIIGLFDNDKAGKNAFNLDSNYKLDNNGVWKKHKNKKGYAFVILADSDLEKIAKVENLSIEFLFDYETLKTEVNGKKLEFDTDTKANLVFNNHVIENHELGDEYWYLRKIKDNSKTDFAFNIVPTLEKSKFSKFTLIFSIIESILEDMK